MTRTRSIAMAQHGVRQLHCLITLLGALGAAAELFGDEPDDDDAAGKLPPRTEWTTSRVVGAPDPPPPYTLEQVFTKIKASMRVAIRFISIGSAA